MSNRFAEAGFLPLIPEPHMAARAGAVMSQTRLRSLQVFELGTAFFELPATIWNALGRLARTIDGAMLLRDAAGLDDRGLAALGVRREELPALLVEGRLSGVADVLRRHRKASPLV